MDKTSRNHHRFAQALRKIDAKKSAMMKEILPSIILPCRNTDSFIGSYLEDLSELMCLVFDHHEIITVDHGSSDTTSTIIEAACKKLPSINALFLARQSTSDEALIAGLDHAIGDVAIILDPKLDQVEVIVDLVSVALDGANIVYALPQDRVNPKGLVEKLANRYIRLVSFAKGVDIPPTVSSCRLFSRSALNFILTFRNRHKALLLAPALSGFEYKSFNYIRDYPGFPEYPTRSFKYTITERIQVALGHMRRALDLVIAISLTPLRLVSLLALGVSGLSFLYSIFVVLDWMFGDTMPGSWSLVSLQVSGLFVVISFVLFVISEYLTQLIEVSSDRPIYYLIKNTRSDQVRFDQRLNVDSTDSFPIQDTESESEAPAHAPESASKPSAE